MVAKKTICLPIISGIFLCLGLIAFFTLEDLLIKITHKYLRFQNNSLALKWYKDLPVSLTNNFYFYNVTNAEEIVAKGAKPMLKEVGPFVYKLYFNKTNMKINNNDTITFYEKRTWFFDPINSIHNDNLTLKTLNAPLVTAFSLMQIVPEPLRSLIIKIIESVEHEIFINKTVKELMFDGYPDAFASLGPLIDPSLANNKGKFGYMWPKNATTDSLFTVFAGGDNSKFNLINKLDGKPKLTKWLTDECNRINDTTNGEIRPSLIKNLSKFIKMFQPLICRPLFMNYTSPVTTKDGFYAFKYKVDMNMFRNKSDFPPNSCYQSEILKNNNYLTSEDLGLNILDDFLPVFGSDNKKETMEFPSGVMDLSNCYFKAPVLMSLPHFLHADSSYLRSVNGMQPNKDKHEFWLEIEPITGITLDAAIRIQINFYIKTPKHLSKFKKVPEIAFPVLWQEIVINWPQDFASKIKILFYLLYSSANITFGVCLAITILLFTIFVYKIIDFKRKFFKMNPSQSQLIDDLRPIVAEESDINENKVGTDNMATECS